MDIRLITFDDLDRLDAILGRELTDVESKLIELAVEQIDKAEEDAREEVERSTAENICDALRELIERYSYDP